jgi:hypothetical protein
VPIRRRGSLLSERGYGHRRASAVSQSPLAQSPPRPASCRTASPMPKTGSRNISAWNADDIRFTDNCVVEDGLTCVGLAERLCLPSGSIKLDGCSKVNLDQKVAGNTDGYKGTVDEPTPLENIFEPLRVSPLLFDLSSSASLGFSDAQTP